MTQLSSDILYDKRLQERFIRQGLLTPKQLQEWLSKLEDTSEQAEEVPMRDAQNER